MNREQYATVDVQIWDGKGLHMNHKEQIKPEEAKKLILKLIDERPQLGTYINKQSQTLRKYKYPLKTRK